MSNGVKSEYVDARRVLLDALVRLTSNLDAFVLVGAQAVYVRTVDRLPVYQAFTTDADLAFDPARLASTPLLGEAMVDAGFEFSDQPGIWHRTVEHDGRADRIVPVDLIVPKEIKLGERLDNPRRLMPKDAGDVFRLHEANTVATIVEGFERITADGRNAKIARSAMRYVRQLVATPRSPGIELAIEALGPLAPQYDIEGTLTDHTQQLLAAVAS